MAKGEWTITCMVCGKLALGPPHSTTCFDCLDAGYKWCSKCGVTKTTANFHVRTDSGGLMSSCIECYSNKRREGQAERVATVPGYKEKRNDASRACKERIASTPEGRARNVMYSHNYHNNLRGTYTVEEWMACLEAFDYKCAYCASTHNLTVDHIVAVSKGGYNYAFNLTVACGSCNSSKGASDVVEWYSKQPFYSEENLRNIHKRYRVKQQEFINTSRAKRLGGDTK